MYYYAQSKQKKKNILVSATTLTDTDSQRECKSIVQGGQVRNTEKLQQSQNEHAPQQDRERTQTYQHEIP